jgi:hypothetical protein
MNVSILLTMRGVKAYQTLGVNFPTMSAPSELEPGPGSLRPVIGLKAKLMLRVRTASREMTSLAQTSGRGGFTAG